MDGFGGVAVALILLRKTGPVGGAVFAGARLRPGSRRLLAARLLLFALAGLPGLLVAMGGLKGLARKPWFTDLAQLPAMQVVDLVGGAGAAMAGAAFVTAALTWVAGLVLTGAALDVLGASQERVRVWHAVRVVGLPRLWAFLRIAALAAVANALVVVTSGWILEAIVGHGDAAGWTGQTQLITLPALRGLVVLAGLVAFGVWAHWTRVAVVADDLTVRRAVIAAVRKMWSQPGVAVVFPALVGGLLPVAGAAGLYVWFAAPVGGGTLWALALWCVWLLIQAFGWHWLQHAARLTWGPAASS